MYKMSLVVVTARPGGIDVLLAGLEQQEFNHNDFETIVVDALYDRRKGLVEDAFSDRKLVCRHIPPRERIFPIDAVPQARNAAIVKARGELILWLVDYSFLGPKCLAEHWGVYEYFEKKRAGMAAHRYLFPPEPAYDLPEYAPIKAFKPNTAEGVTYGYEPAHCIAYSRDLQQGFYDKYMYSIFKEPIKNTDGIGNLHEDLYFFHVDPKRNGQTSGKISGSHFHAKNEASPRDLALALNGFDEGYIAHCYDDSDFGERADRAGFSWLLLHEAAQVDIVNARHLFPHMIRRSTDHKAQEGVYLARQKEGTVFVNHGYVLENMTTLGQWWY